MPYTYPQDGVDDKLFTTNMASGGQGGKKFTFIGVEKGAMLTKIKAWRQDWRIRGVEVWMSDNTSSLFGARVGDSQEFIFEADEKITSLNCQASGETSSGGVRRLGAIWFSTDKKRDWGIFSSDLEEGGQYWIDVGSGYCCGLFGAHGSDVDRLGFAMIRKIESFRLVDIQYPNLINEVVSKTPRIIASNVYENSTSIQQEFTLSGKKKYTEATQWTISSRLEYSFGVEVSGGIPLVSEITASAQWTVGVEATRNRSSKTEKEDAWILPIKCPPRKTIMVEATFYEDKITTEYTAKLEIKLVNGEVYKFDRAGTYEGAHARSSKVHIYVISGSETPAEIQI